MFQRNGKIWMQRNTSFAPNVCCTLWDSVWNASSYIMLLVDVHRTVFVDSKLWHWNYPNNDRYSTSTFTHKHSHTSGMLITENKHVTTQLLLLKVPLSRVGKHAKSPLLLHVAENGKGRSGGISQSAIAMAGVETADPFWQEQRAYK